MVAEAEAGGKAETSRRLRSALPTIASSQQCDQPWFDFKGCCREALAVDQVQSRTTIKLTSAAAINIYPNLLEASYSPLPNSWAEPAKCRFSVDHELKYRSELSNRAIGSCVASGGGGGSQAARSQVPGSGH